MFNAAAMAAGGGRGTGFAFGALYAELEGRTGGGVAGEEGGGSAETSFEVGDGGEGEEEEEEEEVRVAGSLERRTSLRHRLRINTSFGNDARRAREIAEGGGEAAGADTDGSGSVGGSEGASTNGSVDGSEGGGGGRMGEREREKEREVWSGEVSCVVGLQKRGLRGLMEGRRMRERGKNAGAGVGKGVNDGNGDAGGGRMGLGIA